MGNRVESGMKGQVLLSHAGTIPRAPVHPGL